MRLGLIVIALAFLAFPKISRAEVEGKGELIIETSNAGSDTGGGSAAAQEGTATLTWNCQFGNGLYNCTGQSLSLPAGAKATAMYVIGWNPNITVTTISVLHNGVWPLAGPTLGGYYINNINSPYEFGNNGPNMAGTWAIDFTTADIVASVQFAIGVTWKVPEPPKCDAVLSEPIVTATDNEVKISWTSSKPTTTYAKVWRVDKEGVQLRKEKDSLTTSHHVHFFELQFSTRYYYSVGGECSESGPQAHGWGGSFTTLLAPWLPVVLSMN